MAQRVNIVMTSDLSGDEGAESYAFGLDGQDYEIDLTPKEGEALRKALAKYVGAARQVKGRGGRRKGAAAVKGGPTAAEIREWAQANTDLEVPARGRIPNEVREAYDAAH